MAAVGIGSIGPVTACAAQSRVESFSREALSSRVRLARRAQYAVAGDRRPTRRRRSCRGLLWPRSSARRARRLGLVAGARAMTVRALSDVRPVPRRVLSRTEAAMYIGISASKFDELVVAGTMPRPVKIGARKVWDI